MADIKSQEARSRNMAAIHSKNTKPEVFLRLLLYHAGYRYRKNDASVYGHPDLYLSRYKTAVFVNGCFWHRHQGCKYAYMPKTRVEFWQKKFDANVKRDQKVRDTLREQGIRELVVWECTLKQTKKEKTEMELLMQIGGFINSDEDYAEL